MAIAYLLDTSWVIGYLRGQAQVVARLEELRPAGLGVSMITVAELEIGIVHAQKPAQAKLGLENFMNGVTVLDVTRPICKLFAEWTVRLEQRGQRLEHFDILIAATALQHQLTLCTFNRRHFERVEGLALHPPLPEEI